MDSCLPACGFLSQDTGLRSRLLCCQSGLTWAESGPDFVLLSLSFLDQDSWSPTEFPLHAAVLFSFPVSWERAAFCILCVLQRKITFVKLTDIFFQRTVNIHWRYLCAGNWLLAQLRYQRIRKWFALGETQRLWSELFVLWTFLNGPLEGSWTQQSFREQTLLWWY